MNHEVATEADCRRVIILDNGLERIGDHSFAIARAVSQKLATSDLPVTIYSFRDVEPALRDRLALLPHFQWSMYGNVPASRLERFRRRLVAALAGVEPDRSPSEAATARILNESFRTDLERLPPEIWARGNLILCPGLIQHQILGLAQFLHQNRTRIAAKIVCQLMFEPSWQLWTKPPRLGAVLYAKAFRLLGSQIGQTVFFTTENAFLADTYDRLFGLSTGHLPVPLPGAGTRAATDSVIRLGFFGYSKIEKGFDLLPVAIDICRKTRDDLAFTIQIHHHHNEKPVIKAEQALRNMPGLRLLDGVLAPDRFSAEAALVDIVLLPYHPGLFGLRGSGIFTESVSGGRLIVASRNTWAGRSVEAGESIGEVFDTHTSEALAHSILRLCELLPQRRPLALAKASAFARANSIESYLKAAFAITALRPPATLSLD